MDSHNVPVSLIFSGGECVNYSHNNPLGLTLAQVRRMWPIIRNRMPMCSYTDTVIVEARESPEDRAVLNLSVWVMPEDTDGDGKY